MSPVGCCRSECSTALKAQTDTIRRAVVSSPKCLENGPVFAISERCGFALIGPEYGKNRRKRAITSQNSAEQDAKALRTAKKRTKYYTGLDLPREAWSGMAMLKFLTRPLPSLRVSCPRRSIQSL
jgi:hypothetical protein